MTKKHLLTLVAATTLVFTVACEMLPIIRPGSQPSQAGLTVPSPRAPQSPDPPSRTARVSYLQGSVSFQAAGTEAWSRAELNRPLAEGDALWIDGAARAELDIGSAAIRMDSGTRLEFLRFDDWTIQARVIRGVISVTVRRLAAGEAVEIDTPNAAVTLLQPGQYRLDVQPQMDSTFVTVRSGDAEVSGTRVDFSVHSGQRANISGPDAVEWGLAAAPASDGFDQFAGLHEHRVDTSFSAQYVAPDTIGYHDLDEFGAWRVDATWGPLWTPNGLDAGWAPYRSGHWTWVELWGWTWIDDARWGFAPFHYGRWIYLDGEWSWVPGPRQVSSTYAPALVVFVGGAGRGGVAWFPIGPGEVYVPPYRCSSSYLASINAANTRPGYANRSAAGAVTVVPRSVFVRGQHVAPAAALIPPHQASLAPVYGTAPHVAPVEESLSPRRDRFVLEPPEIGPGQTVIGRRAPAPRPIPFRLRQPALDSHPGRPLEQSELEGLRKARAEPERSDVRPARLGVLQRESVSPPEPVRKPQ